MDAADPDFFDTLARTDFTGRFKSFTAAETARLQTYNTLADTLGREEFNQSGWSLHIGGENGDEFIHAGQAQLRSMAACFRQLWAPGERASFTRTLDLLLDRIPDDAEGEYTRLLLGIIGRRFIEAGQKVMMKHVWLDDPMGVPKEEFTADQVVRDWLYGVVLHSDPDKAARVKSWSPLAYDSSTVKSIGQLSAVMWELHLVAQDAAPPAPAVASAA